MVWNVLVFMMIRLVIAFDNLSRYKLQKIFLYVFFAPEVIVF